MALNATMRVRYFGHDIEFDLFRTGTEELREIKRKSGMTVKQFLEGVTDLDVDAMLCLKWLIRRASGDHAAVLDMKEDFGDYWEFMNAWQESETADEEPDPTLAGSLPATQTLPSNASSAPTSTSSPSSTVSPSPVTAVSANGKSDGSPSLPSSPTSPPSTSW